MKQFKVGIDSYSILPLGLSPFETLDWVNDHGGEGVQFTGLNLEEGKTPDERFLNDLAGYAAEKGLYLEWGGAQHIPFDMSTWKPKELLPQNRAAAEQAALLGTTVIRSCSGGLMRWNDDSPPTEILLRETAKALLDVKPVLDDLGIFLAIETHFEFTTFELLRVFEACKAEPGGCFGICLDTMNLLTMLEDPVAAVKRILPWVVSTHLKDGGVHLNDEGLVSFTAEAGAGLVDLEAVLALLSTLDRTINLSIEDHGGSFPIPIFDPFFLSRFPDLTASELSRLVKTARTGDRLMREGKLAPIERSEWPLLCEKRIASGIKNIKGMVRHSGLPGRNRDGRAQGPAPTRPTE